MLKTNHILATWLCANL